MGGKKHTWVRILQVDFNISVNIKAIPLSLFILRPFISETSGKKKQTFLKSHIVIFIKDA